MKNLTWIDTLITELDTGLRSILPPQVRATTRPMPQPREENQPLTPQETKHIIGLMRVNHSGEVCAQALYQGQAFTASQPALKTQLKQAALEEEDHLGWCETRLHALGGHVSILNPIWYMASLMLGASAGLLGDKISLGFIVEVERQVEAHLNEHLTLLPQADKASRAVLLQMREDESKHADAALKSGGIIFPPLIKAIMRFFAKGMTKTSYYF